MADIEKHVSDLFKKHKRIFDDEYEDYASHPFYLALEREHSKHGVIVLDMIERCIFDSGLERFHSVYRAIYYCGDSAKTDIDTRVALLERVIRAHPDWIVRKEAVAALVELGCYNVLEKMHDSEQDIRVKAFIRDRLCNANRIKGIPY